MAIEFFSSKFKQYFLVFTDCLSLLFSFVHFLLATVSVFLGCSHFHFSAFNFSLHCLLPHLICFFWAFLTLLGPFQLVYCLELAQLSIQDTLVSHYKSLFPGRLEEQHSPVFDVLVQWSSPIDSTSWQWAGVGAVSWLFLLTNCCLEHVSWLVSPICPCKSGQYWSFLIYMFSVKHKTRFGHPRGFQTLMAWRYLLECHSIHLRWWKRNWCLNRCIHLLF